MQSLFDTIMVFTLSMLKGKAAAVMASVEPDLYAALCLYHNPNIDPAYFESDSILYKALFGFILVLEALGITMFVQLKSYNKWQKP